MKCAMELITIATKIATEQETTRRMEEARKIAKTRKDTLEFCEKMANKIEQLAESGKYPIVSFCVDEDYSTMTPTYKDYADGKLSYKYVGTVEVNFEIIQEWFSDYCFQVKKESYTYRMYGFGYQNGYKITIEPAPECE